MTSELALEVLDADGGAEAEAISASLSADLDDSFGRADARPLLLLARRGHALLGGLRGASHWRWLYVRQIWVAEPERRAGIGTLLIREAIVEACRRNCVGAYIDTFDKNMVSFYRRFGFHVVGSIDNFPPGHSRTFLSLAL